MIRNPTKREIISNLQMEGVFTIEEALVVEYMENHMITNENDNNIL